ncbi:MAG TPA: M24 family metallopeptidase [Xanthobacteraceae bacterium]|nr:M24 family metallopeptidase [Xanthobacteraceae bacterium]
MSAGNGLSERLQTPISTAELERRWKAVRAAMEREKIDVLLMQNNNDYMGGYVKYFTDMPATNGYPNTVIFPRDDEMTVVAQGPFGGNEITAHGNGTWRGVKRIMTTPSYASAHYTKDYDPELACKALEPYAKGTIGLVGTYQMSFAMVDHVKRRFPGARYVDASELVDRIKVIKSPEEMELVRRAALMQDGAMQAAFSALKPGMRDTEVAAIAQHYSQSHGSENGIYLCASMPADASAPIGLKPAKFGQRHMQNRVIQKGDAVALLVEDSGPGGMYTELGRTCVVGMKVPQAMREELEFVKEARKVTLDMLKPGTPCKEVWETFNAFMRKHGRPEEKRLYCHGQGYDLVERPLVRHDEPWSIEKDMNIVVHPTYVHGGYLNWLCDNYLIGGNGPGPRLHQFPEIIVEVD